MSTKCPVGFCDPTTALPVEVTAPGEFCTRHWLKLSAPMQRQLQAVRARRLKADIERVTSEAIKEARRLDDHWHRFAIVERETVEPFESWDPAVRRYFDLRDEGFAPTLIACSSGRMLTGDEIRSYCPHEARSADGTVLASSTEPGRPKGSNSIQWVVALAYKRHADDRGFCKWPGGERPIVVNLITQEEMEYGEAVRIAARLPIETETRHV